MRATLKDVAARADVSAKTVSNVINGSAVVRPDTRARVEAALAELDYVPNLSARGLRNGRSGVIALALPDLATAYSAEMAHAFVEAAHERGWAVQIEETGARPEREATLLSRARARMVDGVVLNPTVADEFALPDDPQLRPAAVLIGEVPQNQLDQVLVDPDHAAYDMTTLLARAGHQRIAVVGAALATNTFTSVLRTRGYRRALADAGLGSDARLEIACDDWTARGGAAAVSAFLDRERLPDAFFCFTDTLAIGVLSELWRRGIHIPHDVSVAGFDDVADGEFAVPPLTTVSFDKRAFADEALELLAGRIADRGSPARAVTVPYRIVQRESTRQR
ncbi:LacI family DNA-binding transcriptional regulator [Microbacterium horticulturae]|uniref:LacI family DNA-binding transcriptional regulator n=1 Tax=Microbacterium horticulturae TaxID=3028316 RepID=A0ABY8BZA6_9MICO|nr:LacI family DNA-binding transcriptional regulator [Microbacterium sp. KACC 23027]WEG09535.1 LacI family DNA-binding transcriptional regulator [Microbacterium sp. KACC 23027]